MFNLVDNYIGGFPLLIVGLLECLVLAFGYGGLSNKDLTSSRLSSPRWMLAWTLLFSTSACETVSTTHNPPFTDVLTSIFCSLLKYLFCKLNVMYFFLTNSVSTSSRSIFYFFLCSLQNYLNVMCLRKLKLLYYSSLWLFLNRTDFVKHKRSQIRAYISDTIIYLPMEHT